MKKISTANYYSYSAYREKVTLDLQDKLANAPEDHLIQYITLNETRMNRLDKTIKLTDKTSYKLQHLTEKYTFYVLSEGWCGDAAQIVPIINIMCEATKLIDLKIIFRDENLDIMDQYLTNGTQSIPKLVIFNANDEEIAVWGPRPEPAANIIIENKKLHGKVTEDGVTALQLWYAKDKGVTIQEEILNFIK
jgi:hypothetical protein